MHVALVSCEAVGTWPVAPTPDDPSPWARDDAPLRAALVRRGARVSQPAWSDATVDWSSIDVALLRSPWDYHHRRAAFVQWAEETERVTRLLNPASVVAWNTHKSYLRQLEVPQPPMVWLREGEEVDLAALLADQGWDRAMVKPAVGATAEGTFRFGVAEVAAAAVHVRALLAQGEAFVQPYVCSVETTGERSAIVIGGLVTHCVQKLPVQGDYRVQDDYGATDAPYTPTDEEAAFVAQAMAAVHARFGTLPYARVDWLSGPVGPWLVELELVEPCLFFRHGLHAADNLAAQVLDGL